MATYSPPAIRAAYEYVKARYPDVQLGGIYANKPGYHNSRNGNKALGRPDDYSCGGPGQPPADRRGDPWAASALDITPRNAATHHLFTRRMLTVLPRDDDPRAWPIREFYGSLDGNGVDGYSRWKGQRATSDPSHEWHGHWSGYREYADDFDAWLGIAELICGVPLSESETKHGPKNEAPKPTKPSAPEQPASVPVTPEPAPTPAPFKPKLWRTLNAGSGNLQGAIVTRSNIFVARAWKRADGSEDCQIIRFTRDGKRLDDMLLDASRGNKVHPTGWGVSDGNIIWITWNGEGLGNDVVTVNYRPTTKVTKPPTQEMRVFSDGNVQIAFDDSRNLCALRTITRTTDRFDLRNKQDVLDNIDKPLATLRLTRADNRVMQGFTVCKGHLYVLLGLHSAKSPFVIEKWSFDTAKKVAVWKIDDELGDEPEGIDAATIDDDLRIVFGMKKGKGDDRRLLLFTTTP